MVMGYWRHALKEGPMRLGLLGALLLAGCNPLDPTGDVFTLYRNSGVDKNMRVHVASFDVANGGDGYNDENCRIAAGLFQAQEGVTVRYWCEKGRFRK